MQATTDPDISEIYVGSDIDIGRVYESTSNQKMESDITRDLLIYGDRGATLDWRWSRAHLRVQANTTVTITGEQPLQPSWGLASHATL